jgi:Co/Zn/Cd efflux system component
MTLTPKNALLLIAACALSTGAQAHSGHGMLGAHWHATDTLGFILLVNAVAVVAWFIGRGK